MKREISCCVDASTVAIAPVASGTSASVESAMIISPSFVMFRVKNSGSSLFEMGARTVQDGCPH